MCETSSKDSLISIKIQRELLVSSLLASGIGKNNSCNLKTIENNSEKIYGISIKSKKI